MSEMRVTHGPVELEIVCYFADRRRRDLDNVVKAVSDGLGGVAYADDSQVVKVKATRREGEPRTIVCVAYLDS